VSANFALSAICVSRVLLACRGDRFPYPQGLIMFGRRKAAGNSSTSSIIIPSSAWRTCFILVASIILVLFVHTGLSPALSDFVREFNVSYTLASWALTAYMVSGAVMTIIIGRLADLYGARRMLLIELLCYTAGVGLAGFAQDFYSLLIIRALQGIAVANTPLAMKIIRDEFPNEKFSIGSSIIGASFSAGMAVGLILGAILLADFGWRSIFFIVTPVAMVVLFLVWAYVGRAKVGAKVKREKEIGEIRPPNDDLEKKLPENKISVDLSVTTGAKSGIDLRGAIALAVCLTSILLAITFAGTISTTFTAFVIFLVLGAASLVVFFAIEKRSRFPLINLKLMFSPLIRIGNMVFLMVGVLEYLIFQATPTLAIAPPPSGFGLPVAASGLVQIPYITLTIVIGLVSGIYIVRKGPLRLVLPGATFCVGSIALLLAFHSTFEAVAGELAIFGIGIALIISAGSYTLITSSSKEYTGLISAASTDLRVIGGALGPIIAGTFMTVFVVPYEIGGVVEYFPSPKSFTAIFLIALLFAITMAIMAIVFRRRASRVLATGQHRDAAA
jgi:MFS family permease